MKRHNFTSNQLGLTRVEIVAIVVMLICLITVIGTMFIQKRRSTEIAIASVNLQQLYQNQVLQYFSTKRFNYSLTRMASWPDFFSARPPLAEPELLKGMEDEQIKYSGDRPLYYVPWKNVGFALDRPSYFVYRVEPEPAFEKLVRESVDGRNPFHFHAMAIGDIDGDGDFAVIVRGGYVDKEQTFMPMKSILVSDFTE